MFVTNTHTGGFIQIADGLTEALYSLRNSEFLVDRPVGHLPLLEVGTHTHTHTHTSKSAM